MVFGNRAELQRTRAATLLALADAATGRAARRDRTPGVTTVLLHGILVDAGIPARLGGVDEGYRWRSP